MFERELTDVVFLQRWGIVRTIRPQSVAEHTFLVAHYANDICVLMNFPERLHLAVLQYALWHDVDEIFTGDQPGPNKRGLLDAVGPEASGRWSAKMAEWMERAFKYLNLRNGGKHEPDDAYAIKLVVKAADWLEASVKMATETQMGNQCTLRHIDPNLVGALETAEKLCQHLYAGDDEERRGVLSALRHHMTQCVDRARSGQSLGPWVTKEDETRTYKDPCVDA